MRLVGGKDFYDSALRHGHDDHLVFVRENNRLVDDSVLGVPPLVRMAIDGPRLRTVLTLDGSFDHIRNRVKDQTYKIGRLSVVFCGKLHYGLIVEIDTYDAATGYRSVPLYFWQADQFVAWLDGNQITIAHASSMERTDQHALEKLFAVEEPSLDQFNWLVTNIVTTAIRRPTMRYERSHGAWEINPPRLKDVEFYRKINPYQAFQEIEMWVGGVLPGVSPDTAAVDDATRLVKHGFDKTSFKKAKTKKK